MGRFNIFDARGNHRADIRDTDATMIGTWALDLSVGWEGNHNEGISYAGDQDFWGINCNAPPTGNGLAFASSATAGYVSNKSQGGTNAGNGDYHLTASNNRIASGRAMIPYGIDGLRIPNDGSGAAGALQIVPVYTTPYGSSYTGTIGSPVLSGGGHTEVGIAATPPLIAGDTIILSSSEATDVFSSDIGDGYVTNGTGPVVLTMTTTSGQIYFRITASVAGARTITITNGQGGTNPSPVTITVAAAIKGTGALVAVGVI